MKGNDPDAAASAVWLTISCALGFVFYMINSELVCYYKIAGAYFHAHIMFLAESFLFPLGFKIMLGELFGVKGLCMGGFAAEAAVLLLNLGMVTCSTARFPRRISDFRMDRQLARLAEKHL